MARVKQHRRCRFLSKDAALRVKAIQEEAETKTMDPAAACAAIDAAELQDVEFQEAAENKFDDEQVSTILGYCDDVDVDDVYVEELRVVVEDEDEEDQRSMWGNGDKNPADVEEE
eukprot:TRINITY_DN2202_c0_g1_i2.p2 TRINITY_DN2202_c0_g1~~TRINITY_DN2202_c0_g1_i2.p2  ORF type:complete len:135 (-),score=44.70 TRINITY_DN2202_c0_g1_i2:102-446(-)